MRSNDRYWGSHEARGRGRSSSLDDLSHDLNETLSSLERRMDMVDRPSRGRSDLDEIRDRQMQIGRRQSAQKPVTRAQDLKQELANLRQQLAEEQALASRHSPSTSRAGRRPDDGSMSDLRADIEQLKQDVTLLAREDSVRELTDRWTVLEREFARLPETLGSREDLLGVVDRIDRLSENLAALPQAIPVKAMENQLHGLANAMERMAAAQQPVSAQGIDSVHNRLDEISRAIATIPASPSSTGADNAALERLEARITGLAQAIEARDEPEMDRIEDHFASLARRIDEMQQVAAAATQTEPLDAINARLESLHGSIQQMAAQPGTPASAEDMGMLSAMASRLEGVAARVDAQEQLANKTVGTITSALDNRMEQLAAYLDQNRPAGGATPDLSPLEARLDEIGSMLSRPQASDGAATLPSADLANLEAQIAHLSQELSARPTAGSEPAGNQLVERLNAIEGHLRRGEDDIMATALAAAEQAVGRIDPASSDKDHQAIRELADRLSELDSLSRETSSRNTQTFEAIHDTLLKVVDHLSGLEDRVAPGADADSAADFDELPRRQFADVDAPPLAMDDDPALMPAAAPADTGAAPGSGRRAQAMPPAHAAAAAALAALNNDEAIAGALGPESESSKFHEPGLDADADGSLDDVMIAPGADGPDLASIIQRVRNETADSRPQRASASGVESAKSDFIAAARRAAQAAVADASVAEDGQAKPKGADKLGALKESFSAKRKPILMGAGAILLALLAIPAISNLFGGGEQDLAALDEPAPIIEQQIVDEPPLMAQGLAAVDEMPDQAEATDEITRDENGFRIVDEPAIADADTMIDDQPVQAPEVAEVEPEAEDLVVDASTGPAVPPGIGSIQLQEAATAGDPKAMFVVAEAIAARSGNAVDALADAAQWYQQSAEQGFAPAQYRIGNFLEKGTAGTQDVAQAKVYYQLAAQQGNASAMHNLGSLTASGQAGEADMTTAAQWFHRAAELGVRDSQFNLGILYGLGNGVDIDLVESYKWFALAANDGDAMAAQRRDEVAAQLSAEDLEMAEGAVRLWQAKPMVAEVNTVDVPEAWKVTGERVASTEPDADPVVMEKAVRNIQAILNETGYDAGPVDGLMGNKTRDAIIAFQKDNGMTADGNIDQALVEKLLEVYRAASES